MLYCEHISYRYAEMCKLKFLPLFRDKLSLCIYFRFVLSLGFKYVCIGKLCVNSVRLFRSQLQGGKSRMKRTNEDHVVVYPIRVSKREMDRHVNLLLVESNGVQHYSTTLGRRSLKRY